MRLRFRLRCAMLAVAAVAVLIVLWREVDARDPVQRARRQLIAGHERIAAIYAEEMTSDPSSFSDRNEIGILVRRTVSWHRQRARDLRAAPGFDPELERWQDEANDPLTPDQRAWLHNIIAEHRDRRLS